jgi:O-antigen ligase
MNIKIINKLPFLGLLLISTFPLFNIKTVSISLIIFTLFSVIFLFSNFKNNWNPDIKSFIITSIPFGLYIIGLIYTNDINYALKVLETGLPLVVFPFAYFIILGERYKFKNSEINKLLNLFVFSSSLLILLTISYLIITGTWKDFFNNEIFLKAIQNQGINKIRIAIEKAPFFGEHPTYFALFCSSSFLISLFRILNDKKRIFIISLLIGLIGIIVSGAKIAIISVLITAIVLVIIKIKKRENIFFITLLLLIITGILIAKVPVLKNRFNEIVITKFEPPAGVKYNSINVRVAIVQCTFNTFKKSPIFGHGTGGPKTEMIDCYKHFNTDIFARHNYYFNSHNQYFSFAISFGILGILIFLYWIGWYVKKAIEYNDILFLVLMINFLLMFLTENLLERQTGNVLFSFLIPLFYKYNSQKIAR